MATTDNAGRWAKERAEQIEREQGNRAEQIRQLNAKINELEASELSSINSLLRARRFDPARGICPRCAINDGVTSELYPISIGATMIDNLPADVDIMKCRICGWDDTITQ